MPGQSGEARIFLIQDDNLTAEVPLRRSILPGQLRQKYRSTGRHNPQRDGGPEKGLYRLHPIALYDQDAFLYGDGKFVYAFGLLDNDIEPIGSYDTIDTHKMEYGWSRVRGNKEKVRLDPRTGEKIVRPAAGRKWSWSFPSKTASQAVPVGPYIAS